MHLQLPLTTQSVQQERPHFQGLLHHRQQVDGGPTQYEGEGVDGGPWLGDDGEEDEAHRHGQHEDRHTQPHLQGTRPRGVQCILYDIVILLYSLCCIRFMHMQFELKSDSWKSSVIYFVRILQYWCILVSNGEISCGLICVCSDDSQEYT